MIDHRTKLVVTPTEQLPKHARKPQVRTGAPRLAGMVATSSKPDTTRLPERIPYDRPRKFVTRLALDNETKAGRYWK